MIAARRNHDRIAVANLHHVIAELRGNAKPQEIVMIVANLAGLPFDEQPPSSAS